MNTLQAMQNPRAINMLVVTTLTLVVLGFGSLFVCTCRSSRAAITVMRASDYQQIV